MKNEEKAECEAKAYRRRLECDTTLCNDDLNAASVEVYERCLKMAKWKDEQFKDAINSTLGYFDRGREAGFVSENSYNDMRYFASKVINELFGE